MANTHNIPLCMYMKFFIIYSYKRCFKKNPPIMRHTSKASFVWRSHYQKSEKNEAHFILREVFVSPLRPHYKKFKILWGQIFRATTHKIFCWITNYALCFVFLYTYMLLRSIGRGNKENGNLLLSAPLP